MSIDSHSSPIPAETAITMEKVNNPAHLNFLDGIRGLTAFYVMLAHTYMLATYEEGRISSSLSPVFVFLTRGLNIAYYAVSIFIVLSGFCLMLPVARKEDFKLSGGLMGFVKRRAKRILPPYYAALILLLGILFTSHSLFKHTQDSLADMSAGNIVSHFLLIHNLFVKYYLALDIPMWSIGWEWQIYFIFALVLLPICRRFGIVWTIALGFFLGFLPSLLLPKHSNLSWTAPWYVGLFAFGMCAAIITCSKKYKYPLFKNITFLNTFIAIIGGGLLLLIYLYPQLLADDNRWFFDIFFGAFTAIFILTCALHSNCSKIHSLIVKILSARLSMALGAFSYSLYLVHYPILQKLSDILIKHHFSHYFIFVFLLIIGVPICTCCGYLFHLVFERPFMNNRPKLEPSRVIPSVSL